MPRCVSPKTNALGRCGAWAVADGTRCRLHLLAPEERAEAARSAGQASGEARRPKRKLTPAEAGRQSWRTRARNQKAAEEARRRARGPGPFVGSPAWFTPTPGDLAPGDPRKRSGNEPGTAAPPAPAPAPAADRAYLDAVDFFDRHAAAAMYSGPSSSQERERLRSEKEAREAEKVAREEAKVREAEASEERAWLKQARLEEHRLQRWADNR